MAALPLTSGAYSSASYIASAQRCVNLYPEKNPEDIHPAAPVTHLPRYGLRPMSLPPNPGRGRCLYRSTQGQADPAGDLFAVVDQNVFFIDPDFNWNFLGAMPAPGNTPVSMADDGRDILIVDGSPNGNAANIATKAFTQIGDPNFLGSTRADQIDTFIILNVPGTNQWYCTTQGAIAFNGLFKGVKTAWPDIIQCAVAIEREVWVFGTQKSEPWYNAGTVPFPFQILPGIIIEQGCAAPYSPAKMDTNVYWLAQSPDGARMLMRGNAQNVAQRISTHAQEAEFLKYPRVDDAIGSTLQIEGHSFYRITFPTADKTWVFDEATQQPWEDNWIDNNGVLHRSRVAFTAYAYGKNLGLDWATGQLYQLDNSFATDAGQPIPWIRSFPHLLNELHYVSHSEFIADVETGTDAGTGEAVQFLSPWSLGFSQGFGPITPVAAPVINFRFSKDGGNKFGNNRPKKGISAGRYRSMMRWRGNGIARDAVFELSSTKEMSGALNGAFVNPISASA
jgi:hypothetical protein